MALCSKNTDFTELEATAIGTSESDGGGGVDKVQKVQGDLDLRHPWESEAELRLPGRKKYSDNQNMWTRLRLVKLIQGTVLFRYYDSSEIR